MRSGALHTSHKDQQPPLDSGSQGTRGHEKGGRRKWAGHPQLVACWAGISWDPAQGPTAPGGHRGGWCPPRGGTRALGGLARAGCTSGGELGPFSPFSGLLNCFFLESGKTHFLELLHRHPGAGADRLWVRVRRELGGRTPGVDGHSPTAVTPVPRGGQVHKRTEAGPPAGRGPPQGHRLEGQRASSSRQEMLLHTRGAYSLVWGPSPWHAQAVSFSIRTVNHSGNWRHRTSYGHQAAGERTGGGARSALWMVGGLGRVLALHEPCFFQRESRRNKLLETTKYWSLGRGGRGRPAFHHKLLCCCADLHLPSLGKQSRQGALSGGIFCPQADGSRPCL